MFETLDFIYASVDDVDDAARRYVDELAATLVWKVRALGTVVACLRLSRSGPALLLTDHLESGVPILIYRVADYGAAVAQLRAANVASLREVEIPQGPCASFLAPGGQRLAVYELTRPGAASRFDGRIDE